MSLPFDHGDVSLVLHVLIFFLIVIKNLLKMFEGFSKIFNYVDINLLEFCVFKKVLNWHNAEIDKWVAKEYAKGL